MPMPSDLIVVNAAPMLALDACDQLDLLRSLYKRVLIPEEVERELGVGGLTALPMGLTAVHRTWIEVQPVTTPPSTSLLAELDLGEAEVITLAVELGSSPVLIDENRGYRIAKGLGLATVRSIGILFRAKRLGLIAEVKPLLYMMKARKIRLSDKLIHDAILHAGETP